MHAMHPKFQPVTIPAERQGAAPRGDDFSIPYVPAASPRELAGYSIELELDRQRRNRGAKPAPLRVPGGTP